MEKKKILILGGAGFLGSHVGDLLTKRGHQVTLFDTFYPHISSPVRK
jgi:dTDP-L-rhamnose 4-epimerase